MTIMELVLTDLSKQSLSALQSHAYGSYIFAGPEAIGKFTAARIFALEQAKRPENIVEVQAKGSSIGIDEIHTLRQELQLKTMNSYRRVVLINNAHILTVEAQNALLKTLEEPPLGTIIILVTHNLDKLALTIRSRCQLVRFSNPPVQQSLEYIVNKLKVPAKEAKQTMLLGNQKIGTAISLINNKEQLGKLKASYASVKKFARDDLFYKLVRAPELAENASQTLLTLLQNLRRASFSAISENDFAKARELNRHVKKFITLLEYLGGNGNAKFAVDMAAIELESK